MRRIDKQITDDSIIESIIQKALVCRIALSDGLIPYIVPLCFGYQNKELYFHSTKTGKKIEIIKRNPNVCFEFDVNTGIVKADNPCKWSLKYQSVVGYGKASFVENKDEKITAFNIIMRQYSDSNRQYNISEKELEKTTIIKIKIENMAGKQSM